MALPTKPSEYDCPECDGTGDSECPCCGSEEVCEECDGTGWDSQEVNVEAYRKACRRLFNGNSSSTWEYVVDGERVGRTNGTWHVLVADFLIGKKRKAVTVPNANPAPLFDPPPRTQRELI